MKISTNIVALKPFIPIEFVRKPRSIDEILRWKATEFRQFILYTDIVVLKNIVSDDCYNHFCFFYSAYRLLSCRRSYKTNLTTANNMPKLFVEQFPLIYSEDSLTYNVYSLLHLTQSNSKRDSLMISQLTHLKIICKN